MKFLKYLLFLIIILVIIFIGKGILSPTVYYESEVMVDKPVKEAWAVMNDESKITDWIKGYKKAEPISGTPNTVGAVSKIYIEDQGQEMVMEETITAIEPNELIAMTFTSDFMNMDYEMELSEKDGITNIKSRTKSVGSGMFAKSLVSFMSGSMKAQEDENLMSLKRVIEENTTNYFPEPIMESEETATE